MSEAGLAEPNLRRQPLDDVGFDEIEARFHRKVTEIARATGEIIVHADHRRALPKKRIDQMGADETRAARHQSRFLPAILHETLPASSTSSST
jgi:hypothetical protein